MTGLLSQFAEFAKTPEGQGLLSAAFGGLAGAQRGAPLNSIGRAGLAGLAGYSGALDRQDQQANAQFQNQYRTMQMDALKQQQEKQKAEQAWRAGLPDVLKQMQPTYGAGDEGPTMTPGNPNAVNDYLMRPDSPFFDDLMKQQFFQKAEDYRVVGSDLVKIGKDGVTVAHQSQRPDNLPSEQKLYNLAREQGYKGNFMDFLRDRVKTTEGAKAELDIVNVPQSDGTTRTMPRADAVRVTSGGGATAQSPQSVIPTKGNASITPELYALIQADAAKNGVGEPVLNFSSNTPGAVFGLAGPTVGVSQSPADAARAKADAEAQAGDAAKKSQTRKEFAMNTANNVINTIDSALDLVGYTTAGPGSLLSGVTGTSARNLAAQLETIKANLGFDRLQQMRDMSPTGGALGSVAVQELTALQSTVSSLDQGQSPEQLKKSLAKIKSHYEKWRDAVVKDAGGGGASADWGDKGGSPAPSKPVPQAAINELKMRKGDPAARQQFDAVFGAGAAARVLGGQ